MKKAIQQWAGTLVMGAWATGLMAGPEIGKPAPAFTLTDIHGTPHTLAGYAGKLVVLEWTNYDCPFVKKHYGTKTMQALQERFTGQGIIWLSICSSAPGKQGHFTPEVWRIKIDALGVKASAVLLDADGAVGRAYGAKTTPHLFVIDSAGILRYQGAIDDAPSFDPKTIAGAHNYVTAALEAIVKGEPVKTAESQPYGCSVKY